MAAGPRLHLRRLHLHNHHHHTAGVVPVGPQRHPVRQMGRIHCHGAVLPCGRHLPDGLPRRRDRRAALPAAQQPPSGRLLHPVRAGPVDHGHFRAVCRQSVFAAFLKNVGHAPCFNPDDRPQNPVSSPVLFDQTECQTEFDFRILTTEQYLRYYVPSISPQHKLWERVICTFCKIYISRAISAVS